MSKPNWTEYFMSFAELASTRSNCCRRSTGAILVKDFRIISTGYNGTPMKITNCDEGGCPRCSSNVESGDNLSDCICCHAEENAIVQAAYHGISTKGSVMYCTHLPCLLCAKMIINAGIIKIYYKNEYKSNSKELFNQVGLIYLKV